MLNTLKYMIKILQIDVFVDINGLMYIILPFQMITKRLSGAFFSLASLKIMNVASRKKSNHQLNGRD